MLFRSINLKYSKDYYILSFNEFIIPKEYIDPSVRLNIFGAIFLIFILFLATEIMNILTENTFNFLFLIIIPCSLIIMVVLVIMKQIYNSKIQKKKLKYLYENGTYIKNLYCENKNWLSLVSGKYTQIRLHRKYIKFPLENGKTIKLKSNTKENFSTQNNCNLWIDLNNLKYYYID